MTGQDEKVTAGGSFAKGGPRLLEGVLTRLKCDTREGWSESEGRTGVRGKVSVPNRGVGG